MNYKTGLEDFIGKESLSKTLRNALIPTESTKIHMEEMGVIRDDELRAEKQQELKEIMDDYYRTFIEEKLGQIQGIQWNSLFQKMEETMEDISVRKDLDKIQKEVDHMSQLIGDILMISRLENKDIEVIKHPVHLQPIVDDILESLKVEIEKREIKVICDLTPQTYLANHQHVQQLMNNLINNAVKYNKQKGNLNIHSYLVDQDYIIEVSDTGRGISLIDQGRVFERFFRCDAGRDKETGGTGLGLAIVKHIVQYYKGTIHLESELGKGTTFKVVLPIIKDSL